MDVASQVHAGNLLAHDGGTGASANLGCKLKRGHTGPGNLLPALLEQPVDDLLDEVHKVLRVGLHDGVELGELEESR